MPTITVDGLDEAKDTLAALPEAFKDQVRQTLDVGSNIIWAEAFHRVPVRTHTLQRSIERSIRGDGQEAIVAVKHFTAHFVEFGTNDTPAEPFLYPAFRIGARYIRGAMRDWAENAGVQARFRTKRGHRPDVSISSALKARFSSKTK